MADSGTKPDGDQDCSGSTKAPKSWGILAREYASEATVHGLNKAISDIYIVRRLFWILAITVAVSVVIYMSVTQLMHLFSYPVVVNIEVIYNKSLQFPAVTICNQNTFRKTVAHENGLYSAINFAYSSDGIERMYNPEKYELKRNTSLQYKADVYRKFADVTADVCQGVCEDLHDDSCCTLIYIRDSNTCYTTAYETSTDKSLLVDTPGVDTYLRNKCSVKQHFNFTFEDENRVLLDKTTAFKWDYVGTRTKSKPNFWIPSYDHTTLSAAGHFMLVSSDDSVNEKAAFYTPYLNHGNHKRACLRFYFIMRKGMLTITHDTGADGDSKQLWQMTSRDTSPYWEYGHVNLPTTYYRIKFEATSVPSRSGVQISIDDIDVMADCPEEPEHDYCKQSIPGAGFQGNVNTSWNGASCVPWKDVTFWNTWKFPAVTEDYANQNHGSNCRNPDVDPYGPWCVTDADTGRMEYCNVPMCQCNPSGGAFNCDNGECISASLVCDKFYNCVDRSDEANCNGEPSVSCDFSANICAYDLTGSWQKTPDDDQVTSKGTDRLGEVSQLISPLFEPSTNTSCLNITVGDTEEGHNNIIEVSILAANNIVSAPIDVKMLHDLPDPWYVDIDFDTVNVLLGLSGNNHSTYRLVISTMIQGSTSSVSLQQIMLFNQSCLQLETGLLEDAAMMLTTEPPTMPVTNGSISPSADYDSNHTAMYPNQTEYSYWNSSTDAYYNTTSNETNWVTTTEAPPPVYNVWSRPCSSCLRHPEVAPPPMVPPAPDVPDFTFPTSANDTHNGTVCEESLVCTFDTCDCGYKYESSNILTTWQLYPPDESELPPGGPLNYYAGVEHDPKVGDWTRLISPLAHISTVSCLQLSYKSTHADIIVSIYNATSTSQLFNISYDGQLLVWHKVQTIMDPGYQGIIIQVNYRREYMKLIGIDDITITDGDCMDRDIPGNVNCTFVEEDMCGFVDVTEGMRTWFRTNEDAGMNPYYMRTGRYGRRKVPRQLLSPITSTFQQHCLRFEYFDQAPAQGYFAQFSISQIFVSDDVISSSLKHKYNNGVLWRVRAITNNVWYKGHVMVPPGKYRLLFELNGDYHRIGFRNVTLDPGSCIGVRPPTKCRRLEYTCSDKITGYMACISNTAACDGVEHCMLGLDEGDAAGCRSEDIVSAPLEPDVGKMAYKQYNQDIEAAQQNEMTSLEQMFTELGHQQQDLIHSCTWQRSPCNTTFSSRITDYGICYTFNDEGQMGTANTGASNGLSLTLNIQEYEYMKGPYLDAGVKMYLHNPNELAEVKDLGFAISPGTHTLVGIKVEEALNLEYPWSDCGVKDLTYFTDYTYAGCQLDSDISALTDACQCRDAYMPGDMNGRPPVCDIATYFDCVLRYDSVVRSESTASNETLSCPKPCNQKIYTPSMSNSMLSSLSMDDILSDRTKLTKQVNQAVDTTMRAVDDHFVTDLGSMERLQTAFYNLLQQNNKYIGESGCQSKPIFCQIQTAVETFVDLYKTDMEVLFDDNKNLLSYSGRLYKPAADQFLAGLSDLQHNVEETLVSVIIDLQQWDNEHRPLPELYRRIEETLDGLGGKLEVVRYFINNPSAAILVNSNEPSTKLVRSLTTDDCKEFLRTVRVDLIDRIRDGVLDGARRNADQREELSGIIEIISEFRNESRSCLNKYESLLNIGVEFIEISNAEIDPILQEINDLVNRDITVESSFETIEEAYGSSSAFANSYAYHNYSEEDIRTMFDSGDVSIKVDLFREDVENTFKQKYEELITKVKNLMNNKYIEAMEAASATSQLMNDDYYFQILYGMVIFKVPTPNLLNPQRHRDSGTELWKVWDPTNTFSAFVNGQASVVIKKGVDAYFQPLLKEISDFGQLLVKYSNELKVRLELVVADHQRQLNLKKIDEEFVKSNFMTVDIFYEQLKYEKVSQIKAYGPLQFCSELGGMLGLLIGCSVLSIIEILDFFISNGLHKVRAKPQTTPHNGTDIEPGPQHYMEDKSSTDHMYSNRGYSGETNIYS